MAFAKGLVLEVNKRFGKFLFLDNADLSNKKFE
jgi:hypothetical protein